MFYSKTVSYTKYFITDIKITHSLFALPFALSILFLEKISPTTEILGFILLCIVTARTYAMGINRIIDANIDLANPRTKNRAIPQGKLPKNFAIILTALTGLIFIVSCFSINQTIGFLGVLLLIFLSFYSYMKRISWLSHWYLGLCLGISPLAVILATTGSYSPMALILGLGIASWTAGFDIIYALQDKEFDSTVGLYSVPARFGTTNSLWISRFCFTVMIIALTSVGILSKNNVCYYLGVLIIASLLIYQHWLISTSDKRKHNINAAFFTSNAVISCIYLLFVCLAASF